MQKGGGPAGRPVGGRLALLPWGQPRCHLMHIEGMASSCSGATLKIQQAPPQTTAEGGSEVFWPVAVSTRDLTCVVTSDAAPHPLTDPRPVLAIKPLQVRTGVVFPSPSCAAHLKRLSSIADCAARGERAMCCGAPQRAPPK